MVGGMIVSELLVLCQPACLRTPRSVMLLLMQLVLISGLSGSGKSIALQPARGRGLLLRGQSAVVIAARFSSRMLKEEKIRKVAVAIDVRGGDGIATAAGKTAACARKEAGH